MAASKEENEPSLPRIRKFFRSKNMYQVLRVEPAVEILLRNQPHEGDHFLTYTYKDPDDDSKYLIYQIL